MSELVSHDLNLDDRVRRHVSGRFCRIFPRKKYLLKFSDLSKGAYCVQNFSFFTIGHLLSMSLWDVGRQMPAPHDSPGLELL
jgi:hypothetical protein